MKWGTLAAVAAASIFAATTAGAADLPVRAPVYKAPVAIAAYNWNGWYAGLNAGGGWSESDPRTTTVFSPTGYFATTSVPAIEAAGRQHIRSSGAVAGGQLGFNWQMNAAVFGVETDFQYFGMRGSATSGAVYPCCAPTAFTIHSSVKTDWLFTARPRLGFAADRWLFYVTGGVAVTEIKTNFTFSDTFATAAESDSFSKTKVGWTAGGGVEWAMPGPWSFKLEYLHVDFGRVSGTSSNLTAFAPPVAFPTNVFTHSINLRSDIVRVGINYHFGSIY